MTTSWRGNATEAAILNALVSKNFDVLVPFGGNQPYDLAVHLHDSVFLRVQCKTARTIGSCIAFNCHRTDHGQGRRGYAGLADVFGVYHPPRDQVYLVPIADTPSFGARLRLEPTRNNQKRGVRFAVDYAIDRWTAQALRNLIAQPARRAATLTA